MSIDALNWVFRMHPAWLDGVTRSVLVVLADHGDEANACHPSVERIQNRTSWSERGVRKSLRKLEAMGLIRSHRRHRQTTRFHLNLEMDLSLPPKGACGAPLRGSRKHVQEEHCKEQDVCEVTSTECGKGAQGAPLGDAVAQGGTTGRSRGHHVPKKGAPHAPEPPENHQRTTRGRGAQARETPRPLAADWQPSGEDAAYAERLGLDPATVADRFRKHHRASGKPIADVSARWQLWCDEDAERAGKGALANLPSQAADVAPAGAGLAAAPAPACELASLAAAWSAVHEVLRQQAGAAEYRAWLSRLALMGIGEGYALIAAPGRFQRDHVAGRFHPQLEAACRALLPECRGVVLQVAEPARQCA